MSISMTQRYGRPLYEFQKDGATSAINRLMRYNGCIVADSVGLGKTWTALAVIKFFELRNERVLVLCPKRLEDNWVRYTSWAASRNNPFEKDRLNYAVRAHTDLSRYEGWAGAVDLANFNWGAFDLIVIDESHNFRNEGRDRRDEAGEIVRRSRYNRLLEEALKGRRADKGPHALGDPGQHQPARPAQPDLPDDRKAGSRGSRNAGHRRYPIHVRGGTA